MNRLVLYILLFVSFALAEGVGACTVDSIAWTGEHSGFDDSQMEEALGAPCDAWKPLADKLVRYYEDQGFVAAHVTGKIRQADIRQAELRQAGADANAVAGAGAVSVAGMDSARGMHVLELEIVRGALYVWAPPENADSAGTKRDVFAKLSGIEDGKPVSLTDLERSERRLARMGYFEKTAPARLYRDPSRNRIFPVFSMRKANVSTAEGVLTYSSDENVWEGRLDVSLYNIAGTARDLQLEGFTGENSRHLTGYYKEPWILGSAWNVVVRGNFDEETLDGDGSVAGDSLESDSASSDVIERTIVGEVGVTRDIGFDFSIGVFFGMSEDDKHSTFEISYVSLDRFVLPRRGWRLEASATWKMGRPDSLDNYLGATASVLAYFPLYGNFISRFSGMAGGIFPTGASLARKDYFALGGPENFKGMHYRTLRSRSYGLSEIAILWQYGYDLSIEAFYQPGLYRRLAPDHGWSREQNYGIGFTQYRGNWSVNLYYALRNGENYLDGIIGFGLRTLF